MQIIAFSEFSQRRAARGADRVGEAPAAPVVDRWAMLHAPVEEQRAADPKVVDLYLVDMQLEADFWGDLEFRLAYPTHRQRCH
jgi:hypothetical protein